MSHDVKLKAVLFDKDGTLIDFHRTWDHAIGEAIRAAAADASKAERAAELLSFDLASDKILDGSALIADSNDEIFELVKDVLDTQVFGETAAEVSARSVAPAVGMAAALGELQQQGLALGVVTNDYGDVSVEQLNTLGWSTFFDHVVGSDSGFGAKPDPGMILGALGLLNIGTDEALVVGDTSHDMLAARDAGVLAVLVTNGRPNPRAEAIADHVIEDMTELVPLLKETGRL